MTGENLEPLSNFALEVLNLLSRKPLPLLKVNAGVVARLKAEGFVEEKDANTTSPPYKGRVRQKKNIMLHVTPAGHAHLARVF